MSNATGIPKLRKSDPTEADLAEMRKFGWTSSGAGDRWTLPSLWGGLFRYVRVAGEDDRDHTERVADTFPPSEAWSFHQCFRSFYQEEQQSGFQPKFQQKRRP